MNLLKERIRYGSHRFGDSCSLFVCFAVFLHFSRSLMLALGTKKMLLVYNCVCYFFFHLPWQFDKKWNKIKISSTLKIFSSKQFVLTRWSISSIYRGVKCDSSSYSRNYANFKWIFCFNLYRSALVLIVRINSWLFHWEIAFKDNILAAKSSIGIDSSKE